MSQGEVPEIPIVRDKNEFENAFHRFIIQHPQFTHRWAGKE